MTTDLMGMHDTREHFQWNFALCPIEFSLCNEFNDLETIPTNILENVRIKSLVVLWTIKFTMEILF